MSSIRFLSLIPYKILPSINGGQKGIALFNKHLSEQAQVYAISTQSNTFSTDTPYSFEPIISNSKYRYINPLLFFTIRKRCKKYNINYLITEHPYYAWLGYLVQKTTSVKWIVHSHNIEFERFRDLNKSWWPILKAYETFAYKKSDFVLCKTPEDKKKIESFIQPSYRHKLIDLPYGIEISERPADKTKANEYIKALYNINAECKILLFNGALDYTPNINALDKILQQINPLLEKSNLSYKILICGSKLPEKYNKLSAYAEHNIIYCGFVDDINIYFKATDVFINPVNEGGGIKTKLVEALAWNCNVVSTNTGAMVAKMS